jgi:hypothetical protein
VIDSARVVVDHRIMGPLHPHPAVTVVGLLGEGLTTAEVLGEYPQLVLDEYRHFVLDDVLACLQFTAVVARWLTLTWRLG